MRNQDLHSEVEVIARLGPSLFEQALQTQIETGA